MHISKTNKDIKEFIRGNGFTLSDIANEMQISEATLNYWLRKKPFPDVKKKEIEKAVERLKENEEK